ncbi:MFS transporter [Corallococcus terminator]|uniref:MFS transporter n=1 Tax=Corallococcus terminator TaxID=2316733 RepID=A0A3A8JI50_9BACT|nr:MFS transporter [Corallococcus terminator]RKG89153.1 MFS transporter [Corallococcus terminator]
MATSPSDAVSASAASRPLTARDIRTLGLAALGGALEFYDFIIFVFFTAVIGRLFFPPETADWLRQLQTFGLFAAGYLARPLGGIVMAHFGDRTGRKRMFTLSVFLMSVPTLLMGLLPTFATAGYAAPLALLTLRLLQGAAVGGEVPGAWVFVSEHVPVRRVGLACGTLTAGLTLGILLGSLVATAINTVFTPGEVDAFAWRIPFVVGGVFGFLAVFLRRWLQETPVFEEMRQRHTLVRELPLKAALKGHAPAVAVSMLITWVLTAGIVVVILMTPTLVQQLHAIPAARALGANSVATLTLTVGCICFGMLADRLGPARALALGTSALLVTVQLFYRGVAHAPGQLVPLYALVGFCVGVVGVVPAVMVHAFPPAVRFSGISFSYNVAYALFGGLTPLIVTLAMKENPLAPAHYVTAVCGVGLAVAVYLLRKAPAGSDTRSGGEGEHPLSSH